jgi:hypothetical protein
LGLWFYRWVSLGPCLAGLLAVGVRQGARTASVSDGVAALGGGRRGVDSVGRGRNRGSFVVRISTPDAGLASEIGQRRYPVRGAMIGR